MLVPFVHYYFQLKVLIRFFIVGGSLVLHPRRTESREGEEERDEERRTKEIREYRELGGKSKREKGGKKR